MYTNLMKTCFNTTTSYLKPSNKLSTCIRLLNRQPNLKPTTSPRKFKFVPLEVENHFAFAALPKLPQNIQRDLANSVVTEQKFNEIRQRNYRQCSAEEILHTFKNLEGFCVENKICLADERFDGLVDGLMDHCEKLTDGQLLDLMVCLRGYPPCESYTSRNFHDIWSCMDDMCLWRLFKWDIKTAFSFADVWYLWGLGRHCKFLRRVVEKQVKKADGLSKDELVRIFFYFNVIRTLEVHFEFQYALENLVQEMTVNELAVVALGYFKSKTKIRGTAIISTMINKVIHEKSTVKDISLTAILKAIRFSQPAKLYHEVNQLLDELLNEMDRLSNLCLLHIGLLGTGMLSFHKASLTKVAQRIVKDIENPDLVRVKDIERLLNALVMFDFDPDTQPNVYEAAVQELQKPHRKIELTMYGRCLPSALNFLSLRGIYPERMLDEVMGMDYIWETLGKSAKHLSRELYSLDCSIEIECPNYKGSRAPPQMRVKTARFLSEPIPSHDRYAKPSAYEKLFLDVVDRLLVVVGNRKLLEIKHVVPHFHRADIVLCKDKKSGQFVEIQDCFDQAKPGDVLRPNLAEHLQWYALVVLGWNNTIRESSLPLGQIIMKERQLRKLGFTPASIIWNQYMNLTPEEKLYYIRSKLEINC